MELEDIPALLVLEKEIFLNDAWSYEMYESEIKHHCGWVLCSSEEMIGFLCGYKVLDEFSITNVGIRKTKQQKGYASYFLNEILKMLLSENYFHFFLEVREGNIPAQKLYEKFGFEKLGKRKNYYSNPKENAILMGLNLTK